MSSQNHKEKDVSAEGKRIILNEKNFVVWKRLTLVQIGMVNQRTLSMDFVPYVNEYRRPIPPVSLTNQLSRRLVVQTRGTATSPQSVDMSQGPGTSSSSPSASSVSQGVPSALDPSDEVAPLFDSGVYVCSTFAEFEQMQNIYKAARELEKTDAVAVKETMLAIFSGLSSSMKAHYSSYATPALLWAEISRTKDPINRALDTSTEDAYRGFVMKPNQTIPDFLKAVRAVEDRCTASGDSLHQGFEAQKKIRLKLDHRFSQTVILLSLHKFESIEDMEKQMMDMWDAYVAAESRNVKPKEVKVEPEVNSTIAAGKRKFNTTGTASKPGDVKKPVVVCAKCSRRHNPTFACDACFVCGKAGHMSRECPSKPKAPQANAVVIEELDPVANVTESAVLRRPIVQWEPKTGLLHK